MGLYDEIYITCPECSESIIFQSKSGPCHLSTYSLETASEEVLAGIGNDIEACPNCKTAICVVRIKLNDEFMWVPMVSGSGEVLVSIPLDKIKTKANLLPVEVVGMDEDSVTVKITGVSLQPKRS